VTGTTTDKPPTIQLVTEVQRLTWEQYLAGEPCRGCGRPMGDATLWSGSGKGLIHLTEEERAQYDSEEQHFEGRHADCHTHPGGLLRGHRRRWTALATVRGEATFDGPSVQRCSITRYAINRN